MTNTRRAPVLSATLLAIVVAAPPLRAAGAKTIVRTVNAAAFSPQTSAVTWGMTSTLERYATSGGGFYAGLDLPDGALITGMELEGCDTSDTDDIEAGIYRSDSTDAQLFVVKLTGLANTPGCGRFFTDLPTPEIVDNENFVYTIVAFTGATTSATSFGAVRVQYQLQVSPAPPVASFNDVPTTDPAFQYIEALAASGITAGCGSGNYCPDSGLTRRQMAVFLAKALGLNWPEQPH